MGYMSALGMAGATDRDTALRWHLAHNHYPPLPLELLGPAKAAIEAAEEGDHERLIDLPHPVQYRDSSQAPAWACIEGWHLDAFIAPDVELERPSTFDSEARHDPT